MLPQKSRTFYLFCLLLWTCVHLYAQETAAESNISPGLELDYQERTEFQEQVKDLFENAKYAELERLAGQVRDNQEHFVGGDWKLEYFYLGLRKTYKQLDTLAMLTKEDNFQQWLNAYPNSITVRIALADYLKEVAWRYRGDSYAYMVAPENFMKFQEILSRIPPLFAEGENLPEKDPHLYAVIITVGNAIGVDKSDLYSYLQKGLAINPNYFPLYVRMTTVLLPQWQGAPGEVEEFAENVLNSTQNEHGHTYYALIADKARSYAGNWKNYSIFQFSWDKIKKGLDELISQNPTNFYYLNAYAMFACIYKDKAAAADLFQKIGNTWDGSSQEIWKEKKYLEANRAWSLK